MEKLSQETYISCYDIDYKTQAGPRTVLNKFDLHFPLRHISKPEFSYWVIFLHGGAFRDPSNTSKDILPALPYAFDPRSSAHCSNIRGIASVNYRLSPYPKHPTNPSRPDDPSRNVKYPTHLADVWFAISWILAHGEQYREAFLTNHDRLPDGPGPTDMSKLLEKRYVVAGHSVGATMAVKTAESVRFSMGKTMPPPPLAVVALAGIYNFPACRDAHPADAALYNEIFDGVLGPEDSGAWRKASILKFRAQPSTQLVVLGAGMQDALVEKGQLEWAKKMFVDFNFSPVGLSRKKQLGYVVMEFEGGHDDLMKEGALAVCLKMAEGILFAGKAFGKSASDLHGSSFRWFKPKC